jgi:GH15 family glucan-1,4-alpha-glucosidase
VSDSHLRVDGYLPIGEYGLIGDCRSAALVGSDGSIDWCCLPRFDSPSLFGRILDAEKAGHWKLCPEGAFTTTQRYRDRTNILGTTFQTTGGRVMLTDFMPVDEKTVDSAAWAHGGPRIVRTVECLAGSVTMSHELIPRPDYGRRRRAFRREGRLYHGDTDGLHVCIQSSGPMPAPHGTFTLEAGESFSFALRVSPAGRCLGGRSWDVERAREHFRRTRHYWWRWIEACGYDGPYQEPVYRSALVLKLMTYAPTGAIVAAPTTSLPEQLGGRRNYDYRFTWLRDASFTLYAFFQLGITDEAESFFRWLRQIPIPTNEQHILNLFPITPDGDITEVFLGHLEGYRRSAPVRIGNGAAEQLQLDIYGEILDSAYLWARFGGRITRPLWRELHRFVDAAIREWQLPDASIWEPRGGDTRHTYSTLMCWVAVDRGLRLAQRFGLPHDKNWVAARREIHRAVTRQGYNRKLKAFTQTLDGDTIDASILRMSQVRFLDDRDPRLRSTMRAIQERLGHGVLVKRYESETTVDGVPGHEGAFLMCSFWLVDALAHMGEVVEAERRFEQLLAFASKTGLLSEEVDTGTGALLGNYPQAFTHLALVGAAVNIERARHGHMGVRGLGKGRTVSDRSKRRQERAKS